MAPLIPAIMMMILTFERNMVEMLLRSPKFHGGVRKIHDTIQDYKHGRDPNNPLRPGEATADPNKPKASRFLRYFVDELRNQIRGTPTEVPPPTPPKK